MAARWHRGGALAAGAAATGVLLAACGGAAGATRAGSLAAATPPPPPPPLTVTLPATGPLDGLGTLTVRASARLAGDAPAPELTPAAAGTWSRTGARSWTFTPQGTLTPCTRYTVSVPAGTAATDGAVLASTVSGQVDVACPSTLALQQALARLGYLPVRWPGGAGATAGAGAAAGPVGLGSTRAALLAALHPEQGAPAARFTTGPALTPAVFTPGVPGPATLGALMAFQSEQHLVVDGVPGPQSWAALLAAEARGATDPRPWTQVLVDKARPERLTLYANGRPVLTSLTNTGVAGARTPDGTWAEYERFSSTTMTGTDPNGTHYVDHGVPWVAYFHGGDAVHGFVRPGYGYPQSNGCVELPPAAAATVYADTGYGTLVTVVG